MGNLRRFASQTRLGAWIRVARRVRATGGTAHALRKLTPGAQWTWGGPMNGQAGRCEIVRSLGSRVRFSYVVETGTFLGASTGFLADVTGASVFTVEASPDNHRFTQQAFAGRRDITVVPGDSRTFLRQLAVEQALDKPVLFYLDAHWDEADLPLWEEIRIILGNWAHPVILIDDFEVPGDSGYVFAEYGRGNRLCVEDLIPHLAPDVEVWCPTLRSEDETGARSGCVVLVRSSAPRGWDATGVLRKVLPLSVSDGRPG